MDNRVSPMESTPSSHLKVAPLIAIIITHYNYSHVIKTALNSVLAQSHSNFECVIVDDCSEAAHIAKLHTTVKSLTDPRFKIVALKKNQGQTAALFEGLKHTSGEFVTLLDPDDLYEPLFLEKMLLCHLNPRVSAAVASCEMGLYRVGGPILSRTYVGFKDRAIKSGELPACEASLGDFGFSKHFPSDYVGWHWGTTSSLMFRRDALNVLRRKTYMPNNKFHADTYCLYGTHMLGGTLFLDELLSWRGLHTGNTAENNFVVSSQQKRHKPSFHDVSKTVKFFAVRTIIENGALNIVRPHVFLATLKSQLTNDEFYEITKLFPDLSRWLLSTGSH